MADGRLITIFANEDRAPDPGHTPADPGTVHHIALSISQTTFMQTVERLDERGIRHSGVKDRGIMGSTSPTHPSSSPATHGSRSPTTAAPRIRTGWAHPTPVDEPGE